MTRFEIVRQTLLEKRKNGEPGFDLRRLSVEVEFRLGRWMAEDTVRKEADMLKFEIPFVRAGKGVRRFITEPEQKRLLL